jgi:PKD repeat protein
VIFNYEAISGTPETWIWDFGNGDRKETLNTEEGKRVETQYTMPGLYTVSLTGKQGNLSGTDTKIGYIYVESKMP